MTTIEHNGHTITLEWHHDPDMGPPWKEHDGHGIVSEWTRRDKAPGERVLVSDRGSHRLYDFSETLKRATKDGWGLGQEDIAKLAKRLGRQPTHKEIVAESVERDFEFLRRWCRDDWYWCGYTVKIEGTTYHESLWGIDSDSQDEFETEAIQNAKDWLDNELTESTDAACRDIATTA